VIKIERTPEPAGLAERREQQLAGLGATRPERTAARMAVYQSVKMDLVLMQHHKCCYCDRRVIPVHNDVEHYRPFARYWWLAWTWENLLFACRACNGKGGKHDQFPLAVGDTALVFPQQPPGSEHPLLVDPTVDDPRDHVRFAKLPTGRWAPIGLTDRGRKTIAVLGLGRDAYLDEFEAHVRHVVMPMVKDLKISYSVGLPVSFVALWHRKCAELLDPERPCLALSEAVLRHEFPTFPHPPASE
jgi:uncharacterized protein (TIGR02646 family)